MRNRRFYTLLITLTAVVVTALEILDGTIVSVSMNAMRGSLGATINQMSWTMTGYITASAIVMPLTGFLSDRFGRKQLMLIAIVGFGLTSALCGFSTSLVEIIILRILQGAFGALLAPLSQAFLADNFAQEDLGRAMSFYGLGLMVAPVMGPVIGGVVTEYFNWRWDFFINIPVCVLAFIAVWLLIQPGERHDSKPIDWLGLTLLVLSIGGLQYILSRGNELQWFASNQLLLIAFISLFSFVFFVMRGLDLNERNIVNLGYFKDKNYAVAISLLFVFAMVFVALNTWIPPLLERLQGYPIITAGLSMGPRGIAGMLSMIAVPFLMKHFKYRYLISAGFLLFAMGALMLSGYNPTADQHFFMTANVLQGLALGLFFVPISAMAYSTLPTKYRDGASGIFGFSRSLGASFGIAIFSNIVATQSQANWQSLSGGLSMSNPTFRQWLHVHHFPLVNSQLAVKLSQVLSTQSQAIAYNDGFYMSAVIALCLIPLVLILVRKQ